MMHLTKNVLKGKIHYKEQDREAKRHIPKEGYVNAAWFLILSLINEITVDVVLHWVLRIAI